MLIYTGKGKFIPGVPARNLTAAEAKLYGKDRLLSSGLYVEKRPAKKLVEEVTHDERN